MLRFTYDRFFSIMMACHLMHVLAREKAGQSVAPQVATWISDVVEIPIYHDVMVHLLIMLYDQRSETDPTDPHGVLYDLHENPPDETLIEETVEQIIQNGNTTTAVIVARAFVRLGMQPHIRPAIERLTNRLVARASDTSFPERTRLSYARLALDIARELALHNVFLALAQHRSSDLRTIAACQAYFLWRRDAKAGLTLLSLVEQNLYYPCRIPKPRLLEFFIGCCALILFRHPTKEKTVGHIVGLAQVLLTKMRFWVGAAKVVLPRVVVSILKDVPSDYNPVNLTELRLAHQDFAGNPKLRDAALEYISFLRQNQPDWDRQNELVRVFREESPNNNFCSVINQLVQGYHAALDLEGAIFAEAEMGEASDPHLTMWVHAPCYNTLWLGSGCHKLSDAVVARIREVWQKALEKEVFWFRALSPTAKYYNWAIPYYGVLLARVRGNARAVELRDAFDQLLREEKKDGLYAFCRGLEIMGAELGAMDPNAVRVTLVMITDILNNHPGLPENHVQMLAKTLRRMQLLFRDEVEQVLTSLKDRTQRQRLQKMVSEIAFSENVGTLVAQGGQDFYLYAMTKPYWRELFADILENFIQQPSFRKALSYVACKAIHELSAAKPTPED